MQASRTLRAPGLDPSRLTFRSQPPPRWSELGRRRRRSGAGGGRRELGGGDRSLSTGSRWTGMFLGSSSSESCAAGRRREPRATATSRAAGTAPVGAVRVPVPVGGSPRGGAAPTVLSPRMSRPRGPSHGVRGVARDAARASCWRNAFVCSGSSPATIFSGLARTCSPSASPTHAILVSHATLLSLSLTFPESPPRRRKDRARTRVSGHLGHDVVEEPERRFLQEVLRELRRWKGSCLGRGQRSRRSTAVAHL